MTRSEHLEWCKTRALEYIDRNDITQAWNSMASDLRKHEETRDHAGIILGMSMMMAGQLSTITEMKRFIEGIN